LPMADSVFVVCDWMIEMAPFYIRVPSQPMIAAGRPERIQRDLNA
jgi:hypothetical protein